MKIIMRVIILTAAVAGRHGLRLNHKPRLLVPLMRQFDDDDHGGPPIVQKKIGGWTEINWNLSEHLAGEKLGHCRESWLPAKIWLPMKIFNSDAWLPAKIATATP